jgi:phosphate transport system protein
LRHFTVELEELNHKILEMGGLVESAIHRSVRSLVEQNRELAEQVIRDEPQINRMEMEIDGLVTRLLALNQPVARDLRFLTSALKINTDLERIGDLAVNIAEQGESLTSHDPVPFPFDYVTMAQRTQEMLSRSLDALVNRDVALAYQVCAADDDVDLMKHTLQTRFAEETRKDQEHLEAMINLFLVSRHLERIADHATNIAEDVIYMVTGGIHRHRGSEFP